MKRGRPPTKHLIKPTVNNNNNNNNNNDTADTKQTRALPEENIVHCICKRPYTETEFMIACDNCNQWFHGECIGLSESQGLFVDLFFCENCSKSKERKKKKLKNFTHIIISHWQKDLLETNMCQYRLSKTSKDGQELWTFK